MVKEKRIYSLDGLRGYAALAVLVFHSELSTRFGFFWYGWVGVHVFFVLSGFLITGILLDSRKASNYFSTFYARRFLRIFPIFYLSLFIIILISWIKNVPFDDFWLYLFYIQNFKLAWHGWIISFPTLFNHTWTLAIEEQFYLFFPLVVKFFNDRRLTVICLLFVALAIFSRYILYIYFPGNAINWVNTLSNFDFLASGALLSISINYFDQIKIKRILFIISLITLISCYSFVKIYLHESLFLSIPFVLTGLHGQYFLIAILPLICLLVMILYSAKNKILHLLFENKLIKYSGKISYGLYLYHYPLFFLVDYYMSISGVKFNFFGSFYLIVLIRFFVTFLISILSWHLLESKILSLKSNFNYKFAK